MKKLLQWLFESRMRKLEDDAFWERYNHRKRVEKEYVAEQYLRQLGYRIDFDSGVREQPSQVTRRQDMGYKLVKMDQTSHN